MNQDFIYTQGLGDQVLYRLSDLSAFKYERSKYAETVDLQAFSASLGKYVTLNWSSHPWGVKLPDLHDDPLIKKMNLD
jgi:hypothetical protein